MKKSVLACGLLSITAAFAAEPVVQFSSVTAKGPATAEEVAAARAKFVEKNSKLDWARITVNEADDATVAALAAAFPECTAFSILKTPITTLAPLAGLQAKTIEVRYCTIDDLSPLGECAKVESVNLYGSTVKDFSPLAKCPKLKEINFYATKADPAAYQTLGALKQCKAFIGGLSGITSLDWVKEVPGIESIQIFDECISDFSPIATAKNLKKFRGWNMSDSKLGGKGHIPALGDLSFLSGCTALEALELPGSKFSNLAALEGLQNLTSVDFRGAKCDVDLSFLKGKAKLKGVNASSCAGELTGFEALAGLPALKYCDLSENKAVDVSFVKDCPALTSLQVYGTKKVAAKVSGFEAVAEAPALESLNIRFTEGCSLKAIKPSKRFSSLSLAKDQSPEDEVKALEAAMKAANPRARLNVR